MNTHSEATPTGPFAGSDTGAHDGAHRTHYAILVEASGLPNRAQELILATVRQTRLSSDEQACVAEELIAHFADGLEAGVSLDELTTSFGESRTVAALIRRAKLRCRPRPRFANFATQAGSAFVTMLAIGSCCFLFVFITPKLQVIVSDGLGAELPGYMQGTIGVAEFIADYIYLLVVAFVAAGALFEWKCRSEYKTALRTATLVGLSLIAAATFVWVAGVHIFCLVHTAIGLAAQQAA